MLGEQGRCRLGLPSGPPASGVICVLAAAALPLLEPHAPHLLGPDVVGDQVPKPAALKVEPARVVGREGQQGRGGVGPG